MSHRDHGADGWESADFPITCESCFGDNPYMRMTRADYDKECKICSRPFTAFRWRPGRNARFKKTEICQTCSKLKNVCQVCLLDLGFGLPVQVRDSALNINSHYSVPMSHVNREYFADEHDPKTRAGLDYESSFGKMQPNDTILKLQRRTPSYEKNRPKICSFYTIGQCKRGAECSFRHEMPETGELSHQNIRDRYYSVNDPVAMKLLRKAGEMGTLEPPEDESIKTLYVGGLNSRIFEQDIHDHFYAYGEMESIRVMAEDGKYDQSGSNQQQQGSIAHTGLISQQQNQHSQMQQYYMQPPPPNEYSHYPSMDTQRMGAAFSTQESDGSSTSENNRAYSSYSYPMPPHQPCY
ncbi:unnamed protein product [Arabidopsis thaliana]|uniref:C3H1-type domain-containing protein n=1 Tax=Arabidopsis thaliana TaxID=3702 RepID=A0A654FZ14_ARATH|nr:unnamed protein product [Arabidopsis thaliana]